SRAGRSSPALRLRRGLDRRRGGGWRYDRRVALYRERTVALGTIHDRPHRAIGNDLLGPVHDDLVARTQPTLDDPLGALPCGGHHSMRADLVAVGKEIDEGTGQPLLYRPLRHQDGILALEPEEPHPHELTRQ